MLEFISAQSRGGKIVNRHEARHFAKYSQHMVRLFTIPTVPAGLKNIPTDPEYHFPIVSYLVNIFSLSYISWHKDTTFKRMIP